MTISERPTGFETSGLDASGLELHSVLGADPRRLRFESELEREFQARYFAAACNTLRSIVPILAVLFLLYAGRTVLDRMS